MKSLKQWLILLAVLTEIDGERSSVNPETVEANGPGNSTRQYATRKRNVQECHHCTVKRTKPMDNPNEPSILRKEFPMVLGFHQHRIVLKKIDEIKSYVKRVLSLDGRLMYLSSVSPAAEALGLSRKKGVTDYCQERKGSQVRLQLGDAIVYTEDSWSWCMLHGSETPNVLFCFAVALSMSFVSWKLLSCEETLLLKGNKTVKESTKEETSQEFAVEDSSIITPCSESTQAILPNEEDQTEILLASNSFVKPKSDDRKRKKRRARQRKLDRLKACSADEDPFQVVVRKRVRKCARNKGVSRQESKAELPASTERLSARQQNGSERAGNFERIRFSSSNTVEVTPAQATWDLRSRGAEEEVDLVDLASTYSLPYLSETPNSRQGYSSTYLEQIKAAQRIRQMIRDDFRQSYDSFVAVNDIDLPPGTMDRIFKKHAESLDNTATEWIEIWSGGVRDLMPLNMFIAILLDVKEAQLLQDIIQYGQTPRNLFYQGLSCQIF